jgi:hypothetical protein
MSRFSASGHQSIPGDPTEVLAPCITGHVPLECVVSSFIEFCLCLKLVEMACEFNLSLSVIRLEQEASCQVWHVRSQQCGHFDYENRGKAYKPVLLSACFGNKQYVCIGVRKRGFCVHGRDHSFPTANISCTHHDKPGVLLLANCCNNIIWMSLH